ncbi:MAG TPA: hypothetical protein VLA56_11495 [Pseudomonadales bacterium]|nr:hypothetical protein [Pseudomonadales bacterium]
MPDDVGTWTPASASPPGAADLQALARAWLEQGEALLEALPAALEGAARGAMDAPRGTLDEAAGTLDGSQLEALIRFFTLIEGRPGWEAGAGSPVVPLFRILRREPGDRNPEALAAWVKSHTDNRFLPYGSLQDRLQA